MSNKGRMRVKGIQCPRCSEKFYSSYRHDFRYCGCGYCFVDGGQEDYIRVGWGVGLPEGMQNDGTVPKEVWEKVNEETRKIGTPTHITMYVDKPKQKYVAQEWPYPGYSKLKDLSDKRLRDKAKKELDKLNKMIDENIKRFSKPKLELPNELPKQRDRKQVDNKRKGSRKSPTRKSKRGAVRSTRGKRSK